MPNENYDPKLSEAGFMDLISAIQALLKAPDSCKLLETMAEAQRAAAMRVGEAAKSYVDVVEGSSVPSISTIKSSKDLQSADLEKIALAAEAEAGHAIPGLRDSLADLKAGRIGAIHSPEQISARKLGRPTGAVKTNAK